MRREVVEAAAKVLDGKDAQLRDADKNDGMLDEDWGDVCHRSMQCKNSIEDLTMRVSRSIMPRKVPGIWRS